MDTNNGQTAAQANESPDEIDRFINQILDEKKIPGDSPQVRPTLVADLRARLINQIDRAMINALSAEQLDQLSQMLDGQALTDEQLQDFFRQSGIDGQRVALDTMIRFRNYYLGGGK